MKKTFILLLVALLLPSCQENTLNLIDEIPDSEDYSFTFTYKGKKYNFDGKKDKNSNPESVTHRSLSLNDNSLYHELQSTKPELCTVVKEDGSIELYDSIEEVLNISEFLSIENSNKLMSSKAAKPLYTFRLIPYEKEFLLAAMPEHLGELAYHTSYPAMVQYTGVFPKKINSYYLSHAQGVYPGGAPWRRDAIIHLVFFASSNHTGQTLVYNPQLPQFNIPPPPITEYQLSKIGWGNKIQSFLFMLTWFS